MSLAVAPLKVLIVILLLVEVPDFSNLCQLPFKVKRPSELSSPKLIVSPLTPFIYIEPVVDAPVVINSENCKFELAKTILVEFCVPSGLIP